MLHNAIQRIRKPLDFSAKNHFANIERVRDLEKTIASWVEHVNALDLSGAQQQTVSQFRELFRQYDGKTVVEKIAVIQAAFHLLQELETTNVIPISSNTAELSASVRDELVEPSVNEHFDKFTTNGGLLDSTAVEEKPSSALPPSEPDVQHDLSLEIQYIKGVGPKRARLLQRLGIQTIQQALFFFPRRYEDRRRIEKIAYLRPGDHPTTVYGVVRRSGLTVTPKQRVRIFELEISDDTGVFTAKWFNQDYLRRIFKPATQVVLSGKISMNRYGGMEMIQPEYELLTTTDADEDLLHTGRIVPIYPLTDGLYQKDMRKIMKHIVDHYALSVEEGLPLAIRRKYRFFDLHKALQRIHFPENTDDVALLNQEKSPAHQRLIFDEFFLLELGMGLKRQHSLVHEKGIAFEFQGDLERYLRQALPFPLTSAQNRVIREIQQNMRAPQPMNRLLQGDVGSGKTLVALIALLSAIEAGYQGAIMVPTEILAEQHFRKISDYIQQLNEHLARKSHQDRHSSQEPIQPDLYLSAHNQQFRICLLTGGLKKREREERLLQIERGEIHLVVGTHALIQHDVAFHRLGLIVIDEQHKFGVMQRATLKAKGYNPDVLIMTATPIPRTLSLTVYGDLDVSIIDELPPGRTPVMTSRFYEQNREKAYRLIAEEIQQGRQVYIVYPLVEESENLDLKAATEMSEHLAQDVFPQYRIGLVHGRMKAEEKDRQMIAFKNHELDILVSTTVLEVGIDVSNATVMLIEHAERFGLSQLHQLRGRVGRGSQRSFCLLMTSYPMSQEARRRLDAMVETTDGFLIAERDLEIRGPGEFFGTKQSGVPDLHIANLIRDVKLLECAREEAFAIIRKDPGLMFSEHQAVKKALEQRWKKSLDLISIG
ncbi:ATP-dependent DNA helicase RecG [Candidatus Vecturithrix granuli]|uniref:ATP-dependent DNA helicase RecG n=1 Tax=Vecturithrix granuli TaxID=1499967 RepID=A0A081C761_VECG1|nr:ATP-dependent DNA helicase RecG [Candidatus Vecturithrix granuli]